MHHGIEAIRPAKKASAARIGDSIETDMGAEQQASTGRP